MRSTEVVDLGVWNSDQRISGASADFSSASTRRIPVLAMQEARSAPMSSLSQSRTSDRHVQDAPNSVRRGQVHLPKHLPDLDTRMQPPTQTYYPSQLQQPQYPPGPQPGSFYTTPRLTWQRIHSSNDSYPHHSALAWHEARGLDPRAGAIERVQTIFLETGHWGLSSEESGVLRSVAEHSVEDESRADDDERPEPADTATLMASESGS